MRKIALFVCLWGAVAMWSCTMEEGGVSYCSSSSSGLGQEMELTVLAAMGQTKAAGTFLEDVMDSLQVFVFSEGRLEAVAYATSDSVTLRCFEGYKDIYAVVNHPEIKWAPDMGEEAVLETVLELGDDLNVMFGYAINRGLSADGTLFGTLPSTMMSINVRRVAVRIGLNSIINNSGNALTVTRVFITNVVGDADFYAVRSSDDYSRKPEIWYNKTGMDSDLGEFLEGLFCVEVRRNLPARNNVSYVFDEYFYCFPNPSENEGSSLVETDEGWTPRWTRLVVQAEYDGTNTYYVVPLELVQSGHSYEVVLTITGSGTVRPYSEGSSELVGGGPDGDGDILVETKGCDGATVVRFAGGCAEVREL